MDIETNFHNGEIVTYTNHLNEKIPCEMIACYPGMFKVKMIGLKQGE